MGKRSTLNIQKCVRSEGEMIKKLGVQVLHVQLYIGFTKDRERGLRRSSEIRDGKRYYT